MAPVPSRNVPDGLLKPFLSVVLAKRRGKTSATVALNAAMTEAVSFVASRPGRAAVETFKRSTVNGTLMQAHVYCHRRLAPWATAEFQDATHELLVIAIRDGNMAICCTEAGVRDGIVATISDITLRDRKLLERAFVGQQAKAMWLTGIHAATASKANAKALIGPALELSLDPLGDQSFFYSAVRSQVPVAGSSTLVGTAPGASRIWTGRKKWAEFGQALGDLFDKVTAAETAPPEGQAWLKLLAKDAGSITGATEPYALAVVPPELLTDANIGPDVREEAIEWAYRANFEIVSAAGHMPTAEVRLNGSLIGNLTLDFKEEGGRLVAIPTWSNEVEGYDKEREACSRIVAMPDHLRVYYDGATLAEGRLFDPAYQDRRFKWEWKNFAGYEVEDEKPARWGGKSLADVIAEPKDTGDPDNSLFAYVVEKLCPKGWLASDDGAMEFADFVHIDPVRHRVSLIHVKGSNKADPYRGVSVASYEVVVGQAVKNIRHLEQTTLAQVMKTGVNKAIAGAVWFNGKRERNRDGIIQAAKDLPPSYERVVIVLQPQLTKAENEACVGDVPTATKPRIARMKQLDTLMLSARLSCAAVGADFVGIGSE